MRIYHEFGDRIDNLVPRVTAAVLPNSDPRDRFVLSYPQTRVGFFFLHTLDASA